MENKEITLKVVFINSVDSDDDDDEYISIGDKNCIHGEECNCSTNLRSDKNDRVWIEAEDEFKYVIMFECLHVHFCANCASKCIFSFSIYDLPDHLLSAKLSRQIGKRTNIRMQTSPISKYNDVVSNGNDNPSRNHGNNQERLKHCLTGTGSVPALTSSSSNDSFSSNLT